jgi:hypothetical protein
MESSGHEKTDNIAPAHFYETPVCAVYPTPNHSEAVALDFPGELIILGIKRFFIESAEFFKALFVNKHEHAGRKWSVKAGKTLHYIVTGIKQMVEP